VCIYDLCSFLQSSDGDIIDCVVFDKQPAFDPSLLKEQKPLVSCFIELIKENSEFFIAN